MCTSSQLNDIWKAFINVLFTALVILYHFIPGNTVDGFQPSGCESGLFLHVNPETRAHVCCITVPLPKGFEFVSCEVDGGYDRIVKCPDGLYQVDNTTTASEAKCSSEIECNPDENLKIPNCDAQGHCIFSCICNYDKGYCGLNFYDCQSFPSDCPRTWVQKDCTCKWKPTASTGSTLGNATNKPVQKIIPTPSTVDGKSKTAENKDRPLIGEEDQVLLIIKNNETGFIPDQKQRGLQHHEIIFIVLFAVGISAFMIILAVYCWTSKRNRKYQPVVHSDGSSDSNNNNGGGGSSSDTDDKPDAVVITLATEKEIDHSNDNRSNHDGGGSISDTENRQPDDAMITPSPNKVIGSRERPVAHVKPQTNITAQAHSISGLSTVSDHVRYTSEPSADDERHMNQISFSEQGTLTMEGYLEFTWSLRDNPNEETALLQLDIPQGRDDMRSEQQQSSEETHTKELHQVVINTMEDGSVASEQQSSDETHTKELHQVVINNMEDGSVASEQQSSDETHTKELHQVVINTMEDGSVASEQQSIEETNTKELHQVVINNMEDGSVASEQQQSSDETHTEELQVATNNMEDDVPEDESLYSQFSSGIYHVTNA